MPPLIAPLTPPEDRTIEILGSIRQAFAEKGFDGASMQDLARAAGMSVGNFYRYFPSKAAIVEAMCGYDLAEIQGEFAEIRMASDPLMALRDRIMSHCGAEGMKDGQLWAEITAAALRKPEIGAASRQMEETIVTLLCTIFAGVTGRTPEEARTRYEGQAQLLVMLVQGMAMRTALHGPADAGLTAHLVAVIDLLLSRIAADVPRIPAEG